MAADRLEAVGHTQLTDHVLEPVKTKAEPHVHPRREAVTVRPTLGRLALQPRQAEPLWSDLLLRTASEWLSREQQQVLAKLLVAGVTIIEHLAQLQKHPGIIQLAMGELRARRHAGCRAALRCD